MKRIAIPLLLLALAGAIITAALPLLMSSANVRTRIISQLEDLTGHKVSFHGDPTVSFSPYLGIELSDLVVTSAADEPDGMPLLMVEQVRGKLGLIAALAGKVSVVEYRFIRPKLTLTVSAAGAANWAFARGELHDAFAQAGTDGDSTGSSTTGPFVLGDIEFQDGIIDYANAESGNSKSFTNVTGVLHWHNTDAPMDLSASAVWGGENFTVFMDVDQPLTLFAGGQSAVSALVRSAPFELEYNGEANMLSDLYLAGAVSGQVPSVQRLAEILDWDFGYFTKIRELRLEGDINATSETVAMTDVEVNLGDQSASGVLSLTRDENDDPHLNGTLAFGQVDATTYLASITDAAEVAQNQGSRKFDVDLRVSANSLKIGPIVLENLAAAISQTMYGWAFDVGDATTFGGSLIAKVGQHQADQGKVHSVEASLRNADAAALSAFLSDGKIGPSGQMDVDINMKSSGLEATQLLPNANGELYFNIRDGQIVGLDLNSLLTQENEGSSVLHPLSIGGSTPFEQFETKFFINRGIASISKSVLKSENSSIQFHGNADLFRGGIALRAQSLTDEGPTGQRLFIGGSLNNPLVSLEAASPATPRPAPASTPTQDDNNGVSN